MLPIEIEQRVLSSINSPENLLKLKGKNINQFSFVIFRDVYNFIQEYYKQYSAFPSKELLETSFNNFIKIEDISLDEFEYSLLELCKLDLQRKASKILERGISLLQTEPYAAVDYIVNKLSAVKKPFKLRFNYTDRNALQRLELYENKRQKRTSGIQIGIKTGMSFFDEKHIGWNPGNLIGIVGRLGVGKSFLLIYLACVAYNDNKKVLFISPEMTVEQVEARWDVVLAHLQGYQFSNEALLYGNKIDRGKYAEFLELVKERKDWITYDSYEDRPFSVSIIQSLVQEHQPDLVAIDGFPLLIDELGSGQSWEATKNIAYGLKNIAQQSKTVLLVSTQATRGAVEKGGTPSPPNLDQVAFGDAFAQAVDLLVSIGEDSENPKIRYIKIPKNRHGRIYSKRIKMVFDVDIGKIGEFFGQEEEEKEEKGEESTKLARPYALAP